MIDRRSFLGTAVLGALGTATTSAGCGAAQHRLGASELRELMARLERGVRTLRDTPTGSIADELAHHARPDLSEQVVRLTIESLLVADVVRSVPEGTAVPPELAERLASHAPRLDRCTHTSRAYLARMPQLPRRALDRRLRRDPSAAMNGAEWLDGHACRLGIPVDNRARLRSGALGAGVRMRRQSAGAVIDECVDHLDRTVARSGNVLAPHLARSTEAIVDAMWQQTIDVPAPPPSYGVPTPTRAPPPTPHLVAPRAGPPLLVVPQRFRSPGEMADATEPVQWSPTWATPGDEERRIGTGLMLAICPVFVLVGLVVFLVGEVEGASWDGITHQE